MGGGLFLLGFGVCLGWGVVGLVREAVCLVRDRVCLVHELIGLVEPFFGI